MSKQRSPHRRPPLVTLISLFVVATLVVVLDACRSRPHVDPRSSSPKLLTSADAVSCGITTSDGSTVDGSKLWAEVPGGSTATTCDFYQFALNNFLWSVAGDHPNFMSFVPWNEALPSSGVPDCTTSYEQLSITTLSKTQAFDDFELLDVTGAVAEYDIRINGSFCNYIADEGMYIETAFENATASFDDDPATGGIWLPEGDSDSDTPGALEIKTSWRFFGASKADACGTVMHCEPDENDDWWGLLGMHFVQKTPLHGEMIWASFEHAANAPDCESGGSNPIAQDPLDPAVGDGTTTFNVNQGLSIADETGWSFFNLSTFEAAGGSADDGCPIPTGTFDNDTGSCIDLVDGLCNTDPEISDGAFEQINVCRRDQLPAASEACGDASDEGMVACLNSQVLANWPAEIKEKWKYYFLIGAEWMVADGVSSGATSVGCFDYYDPQTSTIGITTNRFGITCNTEGGSSSTNYPALTIQGFDLLANTTMETWIQKGSCFNATSGITVTEGDCFSCHQPLTAYTTNTDYGDDVPYPFSSGPPFTQGDMSHLFVRITNTD